MPKHAVPLPALILVLIGRLLAPAPASADTLDDVRARAVLRWGGDEEGGGPYIFRDKNHQLVGFEVDLMNAVAERLGVKAEFKQAQWSDLPAILGARKDIVDVICNGFELTPQHLANSRIASIPYYFYELQLVARKGGVVTSWEDLRDAHKKVRVGILNGSSADAYTFKNFAATADVRRYESTTDILREITNDKLDATIQDVPATVYHGPNYPDLQVVGSNVARGYYVVYLRAEDTRLREAIDTALLAMTRDGTLRRIDERYGLWNDAQDWFRAQDDSTGSVTEGPEEILRGWTAVWANLGVLLQAAGMTILLSVTAMPLAILAGLLLALGRLYGPEYLKPVLTFYIELIRGTPLLLQLSVIFLLLPGLGIRIPAFPAAVLGLAINYSAYEAEIYRAGLLAIPTGQMEAALALGMTRGQALRYVVVPQALRLVIPPVTNDFIALFKDTAVCSVITVVELTKQYTLLASTPGAYIQMAALTAILYLAMSYPLALLTRRLEKKRDRLNV